MKIKKVIVVLRKIIKSGKATDSVKKGIGDYCDRNDSE